MNKGVFVIAIPVLFCFVFTGLAFAQGKIKPIDWSRPISPDELELVRLLQPGEATTTAIVSDIVGRAYILQQDNAWREIPNGYVLKDGDTVKTEKEGFFSRLFGGSEITLSPNTEFKFSIKRADELANGHVYLSFGSLRLKLILRNILYIRTLTAYQTLQGTEFITKYDPQTKMTRSYLYEGTIDVDNLKGKTVTLLAGESIVVDADGTMTVEKLTKEQWEQLVNEITPGEIPAQVDQIGQETQEPATKTSNNTILIFGLIAVLICAIGAGIFIYRKRF